MTATAQSGTRKHGGNTRKKNFNLIINKKVNSQDYLILYSIHRKKKAEKFNEYKVPHSQLLSHPSP